MERAVPLGKVEPITLQETVYREIRSALMEGRFLPGEVLTIRALAGAPAAPETLYAALPSGIWASRDAGVVWSRAAEGDAAAVAVHPVDPDHVVAALDGDLRQSRDGGATWTAYAAE